MRLLPALHRGYPHSDHPGFAFYGQKDGGPYIARRMAHESPRERQKLLGMWGMCYGLSGGCIEVIKIAIYNYLENGIEII